MPLPADDYLPVVNYLVIAYNVNISYKGKGGDHVVFLYLLG